MSGRQARRCAKYHAESVAGLAGSPPARVGRVEGTDVQALLGLAVYAHDVALRRGLSLLFVADNDNAYVGAMRAVSGLTGSLVSTLKALGFVGDPGLERFRAEMRLAAQALLDTAEAGGVPEEEAIAAPARVQPTARAQRRPPRRRGVYSSASRSLQPVRPSERPV